MFLPKGKRHHNKGRTAVIVSNALKACIMLVVSTFNVISVAVDFVDFVGIFVSLHLPCTCSREEYASMCDEAHQVIAQHRRHFRHCKIFVGCDANTDTLKEPGSFRSRMFTSFLHVRSLEIDALRFTRFDHRMTALNQIDYIAMPVGSQHHTSLLIDAGICVSVKTSDHFPIHADVCIQDVLIPRKLFDERVKCSWKPRDHDLFMRFLDSKFSESYF